MGRKKDGEYQGRCRYCHKGVWDPCVRGERFGRTFVAHKKCAAAGIKGAAPSRRP